LAGGPPGPGPGPWEGPPWAAAWRRSPGRGPPGSWAPPARSRKIRGPSSIPGMPAICLNGVRKGVRKRCARRLQSHKSHDGSWLGQPQRCSVGVAPSRALRHAPPPGVPSTREPHPWRRGALEGGGGAPGWCSVGRVYGPGYGPGAGRRFDGRQDGRRFGGKRRIGRLPTSVCDVSKPPPFPRCRWPGAQVQPNRLGGGGCRLG